MVGSPTFIESSETKNDNHRDIIDSKENLIIESSESNIGMLPLNKREAYFRSIFSGYIID